MNPHTRNRCVYTMSILYISEWRHRSIRILSRDALDARRFWLAVTFGQIWWTFNDAAARSPGHSYLHCPAALFLSRLSVRRQSNLQDARSRLRSSSRSSSSSGSSSDSIFFYFTFIDNWTIEIIIHVRESIHVTLCHITIKSKI